MLPISGQNVFFLYFTSALYFFFVEDEPLCEPEALAVSRVVTRLAVYRPHRFPSQWLLTGPECKDKGFGQVKGPKPRVANILRVQTQGMQKG